ncbi:uncharacterized abhydrolase domain-containing protein DDB_G0269086 [Alosa sapidissima]|uniref:uncharacterized abhydrolase domain-containing protein DDB_G0269086 n=1 Tax=Alosa sapidissima TaxID=34773 RepID=UPI001C09704E|nr:uncharacterized abhydrolase domain-containing protein DDB_G0269086 [Alosa sapidissima]
MDSCLLKGWIVLLTLAQLCWAQAPSTDSPVLQETLAEAPSLVAVEEAAKAAFEQAEHVPTDTELPAEPEAEAVLEDSVVEAATDEDQPEAQVTAEEPASEAETEEVPPQQEEVLEEAASEAAEAAPEAAEETLPASAVEATPEQEEAEPAAGVEKKEQAGREEEVAATTEGEEVTQGVLQEEDGVEVGAASEQEAVAEVVEAAAVEAAAVAAAGEEGGEGEATEGEAEAGAEPEAAGLEETQVAAVGEEDSAVEEAAPIGGVEGGEEPKEKTVEEEGEGDIVEGTEEEMEGGAVVVAVPSEKEQEEEGGAVVVAVPSEEEEEEEEEETAQETTDTSESDDEGLVTTESAEPVGPAAAPEDNTLAREVAEETNVVDRLITSEDVRLVGPEVVEAAPTLVESLEELPATPLGGDEEEEEEEEEEEGEDDAVEGDVNVLLESAEPKEDTSLGYEAWKIGAIAAAFFLVLQTVVTIVYILKCKKRTSSSPAPERACEEGGASAESGPAENTDTTLPSEDGLLQQNTVSDASDLKQAQQEVTMTDIKLNSTEESRSSEESSHDVRTSVL